MVVFLNGRFVAEQAAGVSVFDRGFLYGDGLFETLRILDGYPVAWDAHLQRLERGASFLRLHPPLTSQEMRRALDRLVVLNRLPNSVLRLTLTRGSGPRGYSPRGAESPTLILVLHPLPRARKAGFRLVTSTFRVPTQDPLSAIKSCSKLLHVAARAEAETRNADDALLLDAGGHISETTSSNLFWFWNGRLVTPSLRTGALPGITRETVLKLARTLKIPHREVEQAAVGLKKATGIFLTNSIQGIVEATTLDGRELSRSPLTRRICEAYERWISASYALESGADRRTTKKIR